MADGGSNGGGGGPTMNGSMDGMLTPELLYKMNKKIAQLTKVVYGLNTRGEELDQLLSQAKTSEDSLLEANADLQRRATLYKSKLDSETNAGGEAQFYKMECETLKRRLDDMSYGGLGLSGLREDLEQSRRREKTLQYELDQARHAITNMKSHHDFILRETDAQLSMETEKASLECQTKMVELENRYKLQVRHLTDDVESLRGECDMMRRRAQAANEEAAFKEQLAALNFDKEREDREWELKLQMKDHELDEERIRHGQEKREKDQKIRQLNEERRREEEAWEDRLRATTKSFEDRLKDAQEKHVSLSRLLQDKETEFESRLKVKVAEWKKQWDAVEDNLQAEIIRLKGENAVLQSEQTVGAEVKVREMQEELDQKAADYDLLARNLKMRIGVVETEAKNHALECKNFEKQLKEEKERNKQQQYRTKLQIEALERHLKEETERHKFTQGKYDNLSGKLKGDLEQKVRRLQETERLLQEENAKLITEISEIKVGNESLNKNIREKEREYQIAKEKEIKAAEAKMKSRVEKSWVEKLRRTEEMAAQDLDRQREGHKRVVADLKKDVTMLQKGEVEAKRLNEEFKKKVRQLRQSEIELQQQLSRAEIAAQQQERSISRSSSCGRELTAAAASKNKKEVTSLEAKYQTEVEQLTAALTLKQEELALAKTQAEALLKEREQRDQEVKRLEKERKEEQDRHARELKEKAQETREAKEKQDEKKQQNKQTDEDDETEAESNARKCGKLQMELLLLKQQNDEFEEMVREKYRRQMELELQVGEISKEVQEKQTSIDSVKVELCYSKNETEMSNSKIKKMEAELEQHKDRIEELEAELENSERELKRMEILQEKLQGTETKRSDLQTQLDEVEVERDEEIKIIQDALDEAAQEREELLLTFEKEIEKLNSSNAAREAQMLEDFENKLKELEKQHKEALARTENNLSRSKRQPDEEETRQRLDKMKSELNSEWEDKLRSECSRLKGELDNLHAEEKHLAVESIKVQKEQEIQNLKKTYENKAEEMGKEMKDSLSGKDAFYRQELEELRAVADRDVWDLRRKLQKLDESARDREQYLEDKHRDDIERLREDYVDKMAGMESQLSSIDVRGMTDFRANLEKIHKDQMQHLGEQHTLSMERLRDELEAEKFQAVEEARVIVTKHHEYTNTTLRDQLTEALTANTQYRDEIEAIKFALSRREEVIRSLEDEVAKLRNSKGATPPAFPPSASSASFSHEGSQGSRSSQDRLSGEVTDEDPHKASGLLGKVFGGSWFTGPKSKESTSPGYSSTAAVPAKKARQST